VEVGNIFFFGGGVLTEEFQRAAPEPMEARAAGSARPERERADGVSTGGLQQGHLLSKITIHFV